MKRVYAANLTLAKDLGSDRFYRPSNDILKARYGRKLVHSVEKAKVTK
jgi:hypothetical protein